MFSPLKEMRATSALSIAAEWPENETVLSAKFTTIFILLIGCGLALLTRVFVSLPSHDKAMTDGSTANAGDELKQAAAVLVDRAAGQTVKMPTEWPALDDGLAEDIAQAVKAALDARRAAVRPGEGRFDAPDRLYRLRAFVARQPCCLPFQEASLAHDAIHDLHIGRRARRRAQQPAVPGRRLLGIARVH